jgi:hypothetical protein
MMRAVVAAGPLALAGLIADARADEPVRIGLEIPLSPPGDLAATQASAAETGSFQSWTADPVKFPRADGPFWRNWAPPILILRYTEPDQDWRQADILLERAGTVR